MKKTILNIIDSLEKTESRLKLLKKEKEKKICNKLIDFGIDFLANSQEIEEDNIVFMAGATYYLHRVAEFNTLL